MFRATLVATLAAATLCGAPMKKAEREHLVAHFEMTESWLVDEVSHLSAGQLNYHPAPGAWSILDVVEHLVIAEPIYWQQLQDAVKAPTSDKKLPVTDADILWYGIDRTDRQKTEPRKESKGDLADIVKGLDAFRKLRAVMLPYARSTDDDLRAHLLEKEGTDAYQWLLGISAHAQRHILQVREIKASPGFPKR